MWCLTCLSASRQSQWSSPPPSTPRPPASWTRAPPLRPPRSDRSSAQTAWVWRCRRLSSMRTSLRWATSTQTTTQTTSTTAVSQVLCPSVSGMTTFTCDIWGSLDVVTGADQQECGDVCLGDSHNLLYHDIREAIITFYNDKLNDYSWYSFYFDPNKISVLGDRGRGSVYISLLSFLFWWHPVGVWWKTPSLLSSKPLYTYITKHTSGFMNGPWQRSKSNCWKIDRN